MINSETQGHFVTYSPQMKRFVLEKEEYYKILKGGSTPIFNSHYVTFVKAKDLALFFFFWEKLRGCTFRIRTLTRIKLDTSKWKISKLMTNMKTTLRLVVEFNILFLTPTQKKKKKNYMVLYSYR